MKRLILFRHAKTERTAESGEDFDRALTERGKSDAALTGRLLRAAGLIPDRVLVSGAKRTQETWAAAGDNLPDAHAKILDDLYDAPSSRLYTAAKAEVGANTVMVIAHNPGVQSLALELADHATLIDAEVKAKLAEGFPTAAAIVFEFEENRTGCLGLFLPSEHGGGAG
ncbi:MAG: SixA phosphatase family protein [Caulobacteraceae bacterium]